MMLLISADNSDLAGFLPFWDLVYLDYSIATKETTLLRYFQAFSRSIVSTRRHE